MELETILFYFFAALTGCSVLFVAITKNILYAAFALILTFIGVAGLFVFLGAEFIAITQILVYVGGILILLVFGVMFTQRLKGQRVQTGRYQLLLGFLTASGLLGLLIQTIHKGSFSQLPWVDQEHTQQVELSSFGLSLMTDYVLAFEVIGILLLLALIGAVRVAGNARKEGTDAA
ncbi:MULTISPECIES: NADH-quinone oxidoreductase subunit J family protein [Roseivirga]|jgi:NADH-quinone oxidoreductase subunit J|uniref:NADH-quinone oxidoreductase subunit J family protein n=1 Tax=Roseivirga TaxID=290180 RepID=UPI00257BFD93|nr:MULTISPECIES: NADH-quinone oxidoreductase subunit J [Roseivirga]MEC7755723.1 NADH-quinone oxidoreductase subunit J [Bacteroidota bacterium]|tara:strand:- start:14463 stop:14990 length:528 start_codon:yes stop_codon:yes gene_type:complete